jgi:hypothetical protein
MHGGSPALQTVVAGAMKNVRDSDGCRSRRRFDPCKKRMIIHNRIGEKRLVNSAAPEIERRRVVQRASGADGGEQPAIFEVPEAVNAWLDRGFYRGGGFFRLIRADLGDGRRRQTARFLIFHRLLRARSENYGE